MNVKAYSVRVLAYIVRVFAYIVRVLAYIVRVLVYIVSVLAYIGQVAESEYDITSIIWSGLQWPGQGLHWPAPNFSCIDSYVLFWSLRKSPSRVNLPGWDWAEIQQLALLGSSSSLHSEACNALGASDGVIHSSISFEAVSLRASANNASPKLNTTLPSQFVVRLCLCFCVSVLLCVLLCVCFCVCCLLCLDLYSQGHTKKD